MCTRCILAFNDKSYDIESIVIYLDYSLNLELGHREPEITNHASFSSLELSSCLSVVLQMLIQEKFDRICMRLIPYNDV